MADPMKDAWTDVAEGFSSLGRTIKERYEGDAPPPRPDAAASGLDDAPGCHRAVRRRRARDRPACRRGRARPAGQRAGPPGRGPPRRRAVGDGRHDRSRGRRVVPASGRADRRRRPAASSDDAEAAVEAGGEPVETTRSRRPNSRRRPRLRVARRRGRQLATGDVRSSSRAQPDLIACCSSRLTCTWLTPRRAPMSDCFIPCEVPHLDDQRQARREQADELAERIGGLDARRTRRRSIGRRRRGGCRCRRPARGSASGSCCRRTGSR